MNKLWEVVKNMSGMLEIEHLKNHDKQYYSYLTLNLLDESKKKEIMKDIYTQYHLKQISLRCTCKETGVKMTIAHIEGSDTYYVRSFKNEAGNHHDSCHFHDEDSISSNSINQTGWKEVDGNYLVHLDSHVYKVKEIQGEQAFITSPNIPLSHDGISVSKTKASLNQVVKHLVTKSWNSCILFDYPKNNKYPTLSDVFQKIYSYTSKSIYIVKNVTIHDVMFNKGKIGRIHFIEEKFKKKAQPFVLFELILETEVIGNDSYELFLRNPVTNETYTFVVSSAVMDFAKRNVHNVKGPFVAAGFVKNIGFKENPELISLSLLPINKCGVPIESSYERQFYDFVCDQKRMVERPIEPKYYPQFSGLLPDGIFRDTSPKTIIEIFGMSESDRDYHKHREFKMNHYKGLKPSFDFWYWDAFTESKMPNIPNRT